MKKAGKGCLIAIIGVVALVIVIAIVGGGPKTTTVPAESNQPKAQKTTVNDLMAKNDPDIKRLTFTTADYVGKSFPLYAYAKIADYYNYGFRDETKYYSLSLWDSSVSGSYEGVYAYIDKVDTTKRAKELIDQLLKGEVLLKLEVSIPKGKYQESSNAFLEVDSWEALPTN